jgi:hypothetical protein
MRASASTDDAADDGEEPCSGVHHRLSDWRPVACRQPSQLHVGPQLQTSPHRHEAAGRAAELWQPHMHSEPGQTAHAHTFDWVVDMRSSFSVLTSCQQRSGVSHPGGQAGLNGAAIVVERIGYFVGRAD